MFVLTVDQRHSRSTPDAVDDALALLAALPTRRRFERTAGDELQGVLSDPVSVVTAILLLVRERRWHLGVGIGPVEQPLPGQTRAGRGVAFTLAREAVEAAKSAGLPQVRALDQPAGDDVQSVLGLVVTLLGRRTPAGWAAVDLVAAGATTAAAGTELGISRQAVEQRLTAAAWQVEGPARATLARLLAAADGEGA